MAEKSISEEVLALSKKISESVSVDKDTGVAEVKGDPYVENLPETLTTEIIREVEGYNKKFVAAGTHAIGQAALDAMKSNKKLEVVTGSISLGNKSNFEVNVKRSAEYNAGPGSSEKITKFGETTIKMNLDAGKAKSGDLARVREALQEAATAALKK